MVVPVVRQHVQEEPHKIEVLAGDVGHLEDGAYPLADKLSRRVDALFAVCDKGWHLSGAGTLHDLVDLADGLLENVGRANVNLGDDDHDGNVERQRNAQVLLAHSNQSIVGRDHKKAKVGTAGEQAEHSRAQILFVPSQITKSDDLGTALPNVFPRQLSYAQFQ